MPFGLVLVRHSFTGDIVVMKFTVKSAADLALIVCAIVVTGGTASRWLLAEKPIGAMHKISDWKKELTFPRTVGPTESRYRLVVWTDYQCPACKQFERELARTKKLLGDSLSIVYRYFPLEAHPLAFKAAVMAECAAKRGRFEQMHQALFSTTLAGASIPVDSLATVAAISDSAAFKGCLSDTTVTAVVEADVARGRALGLTGTPSLQIGDKLGLGGMSSEELVPLLRKAKRSGL